MGRRRLSGLLALSLVAGALFAQTSQSERVQELQALRARIATLQAELLEVRQRRVGLAASVEQLELELELQSAKLAEATSAVGFLSERIQNTENRVDALRQRSLEAAERLRRSLASLYRLGRGGLLRLVLSIDVDAGLLESVRGLRYLVWRQHEAVEQYRDTQARLSVERSELESHRTRLNAWVKVQRARRQELAAMRRKRRALLQAAEERQARLSGETQDLRRKAQRLENLVDFLYGHSDAPLAGEPIGEFRGVLDWPAAGEVVIPFGPRRDPKYGTLVPHNGVRIDTRVGHPVHCVYPGKVVFAAPFPGYGPTVIVSHPGRAFTLYAGLQRTLVGESAILSLGEEVGLAGDTLYFEIRIHNQPQDPLKWLR